MPADTTRDAGVRTAGKHIAGKVSGPLGSFVSLEQSDALQQALEVWVGAQDVEIGLSLHGDHRRAAPLVAGFQLCERLFFSAKLGVTSGGFDRSSLLLEHLAALEQQGIKTAGLK